MGNNKIIATKFCIDLSRVVFIGKNDYEGKYYLQFLFEGVQNPQLVQFDEDVERDKQYKRYMLLWAGII